jgi:hypothetical protein
MERKVFHEQKGKTVSLAYANLLDANELLSQVIHHNEGVPNKDLGKFAEAIITLAKNWDK